MKIFITQLSGISLLLTILLTSCTTGSKQKQTEQETLHSGDKFSHTYLINEDSAAYYGEVIYVPIYSEVYYGDDNKTLNLSATLSVHNTDPNHRLFVRSINYHNTKGNLIKEFTKQQLILEPLETVNIVIPEKDKSGGSGANFIVVWYADEQMSSPIIEALMLTTQMNQGISFMTQGKIIKKFGNSLN